jgi:hypothetical protein
VTALRKSKEVPCTAITVEIHLTFSMPFLLVEILVTNISKNECGIENAYITFALTYIKYTFAYRAVDLLCGLVVRIHGYRSRGPGSIPGATRFSEK